MFLHSGASLHGHEYSAKRSLSEQLQPASTGRLLKTALRPVAPPQDLSALDYFVPSRSLDLSDRRRASSESTRRRSSLPLHQRAVTSLLARKDLGVRFHEPGSDRLHSPLASEDDESTTGSELTDGTFEIPSRRTKRRRIPRKSTRYALAVPAPQLRTKQMHLIRIRPRLLLQLQEIGNKRATPAFDLLPSHLVVGSFLIPMLSKRFPRIFHANAELSQNDVVLVHSEDFDLDSSPNPLNNSQAGHGDDKNIMAVISASPNNCQHSAEVAFEGGSCWSASLMANGSYEFIRTHEDGTTSTARWVRKSNMSARNSIASLEPASPGSSPQDPLHDSRWTFSMIDPSSRRHPIMGSLTQEELEIYDTFTTLSTSSGRYPPSRDQTTSPTGLGPESRATVEVLPDEKSLMIATASWIRLDQQGWPASANPKSVKSPGSSCRAAANTKTSPTTRRQTFPLYDGIGARATSPLSGSHPSTGVQRSRSSGTSSGRAFMKRRSDQMEKMNRERSQTIITPLRKPEASGPQEAEKPGCLSRVRQWTNRLLHKKKATAS